MAETQGAIQPEPLGRHALREHEDRERAVHRPVVRGRHRMQPPPRGDGVPFLPTLLTLGVLGSAVVGGPMQGEMRIKLVPPQEQNAGPHGSLVPVIPEDDPRTVDQIPSVRGTARFDAETAVKDALKT